jgi:predicted transglutaminase-like cysteine proteinase
MEHTMISSRAFSTAVLAAAMTTFCVTSSFAGPVGGMARSFRIAPPSRYISASRHTLAPFAYIRFCVKNSSDCELGQGPALISLDGQKRRELSEINRSVNQAILPVNDQSGDDEWTADVSSGDCEDFALTKRRHLIAAGWPSRSIRIAVTRTRAGEGHAVLVIRTSEGDLVLDNRTNMIRNWADTDLTLEKIQSDVNPKLWLEA